MYVSSILCLAIQHLFSYSVSNVLSLPGDLISAVRQARKRCIKNHRAGVAHVPKAVVAILVARFEDHTANKRVEGRPYTIKYDDVNINVSTCFGGVFLVSFCLTRSFFSTKEKSQTISRDF